MRDNGFAVDNGGRYVVVQGFSWFPTESLIASCHDLPSEMGLEQVLHLYCVVFCSDAFFNIAREFSPNVAGGQIGLDKRDIDQAMIPDLPVMLKESPGILFAARHILAAADWPSADQRNEFARTCYEFNSDRLLSVHVPIAGRTTYRRSDAADSFSPQDQEAGAEWKHLLDAVGILASEGVIDSPCSRDAEAHARAVINLLRGYSTVPTVYSDGEGGLVFLWQNEDEKVFVIVDGENIHLLVKEVCGKSHGLDDIPFDGKTLDQRVLRYIPRAAI